MKAYGWVVLTTEWIEQTDGPTGTLTSWPLLVTLTFPMKALQGFLFLTKQQKTKTINLCEDPCGPHDWASATDITSPPLKYPSSIFIWRRGSSRNVSSFRWQFLQKLVLFFRRFEENGHDQIRNGQSNCIFTNDIWPKPATGCEPNMVSQNIYKWALFHTCRPFHWLKRRHVWKSAHL